MFPIPLTTYITDVFREVILYLKITAILVSTVIAILLWKGSVLNNSSYVFIQEANKVLDIPYNTSNAEYRYFYNEIKSITKRYVDATSNIPVSTSDNEKYLRNISILTVAYNKSNNKQLNEIINGLKEVEFSQSSGSIKLYQKLDSTKYTAVMYYYDLMYSMKNSSAFIFYSFLAAVTMIPLALTVEIITSVVEKRQWDYGYESEEDNYDEWEEYDG